MALTTMMVMLSVRSVAVVLLGALGALVCALAQRRRRESEAKAWKDPQKQCEAIYNHLCCHEFPWECYFAINFAFYRTFASPSIARLYHSTGNIINDAGKRVVDTDIMMHAWIDFGIDSKEGRESWEHLNRLHAVWKRRTSNQDFVYVLCCFIVDTIRFIEVFGWRQLTSVEREALYHFWAKLGRRMEIKDIPSSLEAAYRVVDDYVGSDVTSAETKEGHLLTNAVTDMLCQWYRYIPRRMVYGGTSALLHIIGGPTFVRKLGLRSPSSITVTAVLALARLRAAVLSCLPIPTKPRRMSEVLMQAHYPIMRAAATGDHSAGRVTSTDNPLRHDRSALLDFSLVGPVGLLPVLESERLKTKSATSEIDSRSRSTTV